MAVFPPSESSWRESADFDLIARRPSKSQARPSANPLVTTESPPPSVKMSLLGKKWPTPVGTSTPLRA